VARAFPTTCTPRAERAARRLGRTRSALYAEALREYLDRHEQEQMRVTALLDEIYRDDAARGVGDSRGGTPAGRQRRLGVVSRQRLERGQVRWADLGEPRGSEPGHRRLVVVVSADAFNLSRIQTVVVTAVTTSDRARRAPGNARCTPDTPGSTATALSM
jgi:hypothetical protein